MKSFLSRLVTRLDIDSGNTRVGLVTYYTVVSGGFNLNDHTSLSSVQAAISSLSYQGGGTSTYVALSHVRTTMLTPAAGDRPNVPNVVVVLTDGQSQNITATKVSSQSDLTNVSSLALKKRNGVKYEILPCNHLSHYC